MDDTLYTDSKQDLLPNPVPGSPSDPGIKLQADPLPLSPNQRAWLRFRRNRLGYVSFWIFLGLLALSLFSPLLSNERPLVARYEGKLFFPALVNPPETALGGEFLSPTDWLDPFVQQQISKPGNWALYTLNRHSADTIDFQSLVPNPAPPSRENWLGTDDQGRDMLARLIFGFAVSIGFAIILTVVGTSLGIIAGAIQGYFGGWIDLGGQRFIDIWSAVPQLYVLIILASTFQPSLLLLIVLFSLFGWMGLSDYVRAEFLRNRSLEFVKAARAMGFSNWHIIRRHILPNSMTPVITFLPFRMGEAILGLTAFDFLGLGVPSSVPSLGDLLRRGKENLDALWISTETFAVLVITLLLLTFIGDALRDAFDTRKS
jgi:microcin C transport system permease protein